MLPFASDESNEEKGRCPGVEKGRNSLFGIGFTTSNNRARVVLCIYIRRAEDSLLNDVAILEVGI